MGEGSSSTPFQDRLPTLNKRAHSVDQNYKCEVEQSQVRTLSNSLKINE
jgi:hypothetical protein